MDKLIESGVNLHKAIAMGMTDEDMKTGKRDANRAPRKMRPVADPEGKAEPGDSAAEDAAESFTKMLY